MRSCWWLRINWERECKEGLSLCKNAVFQKKSSKFLLFKLPPTDHHQHEKSDSFILYQVITITGGHLLSQYAAISLEMSEIQGFTDFILSILSRAAYPLIRSSFIFSTQFPATLILILNWNQVLGDLVYQGVIQLGWEVTNRQIAG